MSSPDIRPGVSREIFKTEPRRSITEVKRGIEVLAKIQTPQMLRAEPEAAAIFGDFLTYLSRGQVRAAEPVQNESGDLDWRVNDWIRLGVTRVGFRLGVTVPVVGEEKDVLKFSDKATLPLRSSHEDEAKNIRIVPGGSSIRGGSYIGENVIMMPPSYVNIGAYVDHDTMIDSLALVGSLAQVGHDAHIAAGAKIGGVLEPANARPCIVEDNVMMLADSAIYEGVRLKKGAVLAPNVILTSGIEVWERQEDGTHKRLPNTKDEPIEIPERALVIPRIRNYDDEGRPLEFGKLVAYIADYYPEGGNPNLALNDVLRTR